ncbi:prepilin-type N-terminal cleavage/methylation domain-containing protein [Acidobacteria bacterium AH-259-L09]|nr:prepilin-type N-terminal cleavage/methylation domain-containing protein [Acidobacteria bacterium AH-259-L09]
MRVFYNRQLGLKPRTRSDIVPAISLRSEGHPQPVERAREGHRAFTIIEMMVVVAMITTLVALAIPALGSALDAAKGARAIGDLRTLQTEIAQYDVLRGSLPDNVDQLGRGDLRDPWGNPYQYLNYATATKGQMRKDKFLVPINSRYDLYSMGKDGESKPPLPNPVSWDDIIRANDGAFLGLAAEY